jgi:signal transduction histidine kinase
VSKKVHIPPKSLRSLLRANGTAEILAALADAALAKLGTAGVAVVEVLPGGEATVVEARNLPDAVASWRAEVDVIDAELGERLLLVCHDGGSAPKHSAAGFTEVRTLPMMSGGDLFGALVLFYTAPVNLGEEAETLVDLAAIALGNARQYAELSRSYAELRASREILERTEKLRALGEMAAGISHDLKNMLNPLSLHLQFLERTLKRGGRAPEGGATSLPPAAEESIAEMKQVVRRGVETLDRLREFSRQTPERRVEEVRLEEIAHEAVELSRPRIASTYRAQGIRLVEELGASPVVNVRPAELVAALLNILSNAIDALAEGGTITVSTGASEGGAWVRIDDDGPGIPEEHRGRIFEPFFTTKGAKEGTGLGLSMVYAFVQRHAGKLMLDTEVGRGTTFTLWFPGAPEGRAG